MLNCAPPGVTGSFTFDFVKSKFLSNFLNLPVLLIEFCVVMALLGDMFE